MSLSWMRLFGVESKRAAAHRSLSHDSGNGGRCLAGLHSVEFELPSGRSSKWRKETPSSALDEGESRSLDESLGTKDAESGH